MSTDNSRPTIASLIELQRQLIRSKNVFIRRVGSLLTAGALNGRLDDLVDSQIAQLLCDEVERDLAIAAPEAVICRQAAKRLFRSERGSLQQVQNVLSTCPKCGSEMLLTVGIDEGSFFQCVVLSCGFSKPASV